MKTVYVIAHIRVKPQYIKESEVLLRQLAVNSNLESGCISYQVLKSSDQSNTFTTIEKWISLEAEELHWQTIQLKAVLQELVPLLLEKPVIQKYYEW